MTMRTYAASILALVLAACASSAPRAPVPEPAPAEGIVPAPSPKRADPVVAPVPSPPAVADVPVPSERPGFWARVRAGLRFADCDAPRVARARAAYRRAGARTSASIERALPLMALVYDALEQRALPAEFLFLPMIESGYAPVVGRGAAPAGMWQIVPVTARGLALEVGAGYDGRLDALASTDAAVALLDQLGERFDRDWRLVTMAYNAGEFRLRRALAASGTREPGSLAVPAVTHAHLARLEALACHARDADDLPEPDPARALERVPIDAPLDLTLAAALAGVPYDAFRRDNAGHRDRVAAPGRTLLVPHAGRARFDALLASIPAARRAHWRTMPRVEAQRAAALDAVLLARINDASPDSAWLVPDPRPDSRIASRGGAATHRIVPGDSLWTIARRYGTSVARLRDWNGLGERAVLKPGELLHVAAPRSP